MESVAWNSFRRMVFSLERVDKQLIIQYDKLRAVQLKSLFLWSISFARPLLTTSCILTNQFLVCLWTYDIVQLRVTGRCWIHAIKSNNPELGARPHGQLFLGQKLLRNLDPLLLVRITWSSSIHWKKILYIKRVTHLGSRGFPITVTTVFKSGSVL